MQGKWDSVTDRPTALGYLSESLNVLGEHAKSQGVPLIYEPLNRYETNLATTMKEGVELLSPLRTDNVLLRADLFHMKMSEVPDDGIVLAEEDWGAWVERAEEGIYLT